LQAIIHVLKSYLIRLNYSWRKSILNWSYHRLLDRIWRRVFRYRSDNLDSTWLRYLWQSLTYWYLLLRHHISVNNKRRILRLILLLRTNLIDIFLLCLIYESIIYGVYSALAWSIGILYEVNTLTLEVLAVGVVDWKLLNLVCRILLMIT